MIITDSDENHFYKDIEFNSISEDGSSCTDSTSSSSKANFRLSNEDEEYIDNDEEDDWKPKKKKRRVVTKNKKKINKDLLVVVSPSTSRLDFPNCIIPLNKLHPVTKHVVIPLVPLPISSITPSNGDKIFFKSQQISSESSSHYLVQSPLNLVEDEQSSIIIFKEDINNN